MNGWIDAMKLRGTIPSGSQRGDEIVVPGYGC